MKEQYLSIKDLSVKAGNFTLKNISLNLELNSYMVLLGRTGSGKTTLLDTLAGIRRPETGQVIMKNRDITYLPPHRRNIGYVSQHSDLFPHFSVEKNLAFGLHNSKTTDRHSRKEKVSRYIDKFFLSHRKHEKASVLSGGESRRAALARAIITSPDLLLLDEPLGMLDISSKEQMFNLIMQIKKELEIPVIHVTHDPREALRIDDRCGVMKNGSLIFDATAKELSDSHASDFLFPGGHFDIH